MSEIRPRIMGTEIEWDLELRSPGAQTSPSTDTWAVRAIQTLIDKTQLGKRGMQTNGGRSYLDNHLLEYATGEEDTLVGLVASELAGEQIIESAVAEYVATSDEYSTAVLRKRVAGRRGDSSNNVSGYHINLCGDAQQFDLNPQDLGLLGLWASTASLYTGAGKLVPGDTNSPQSFVIGQKSSIVTKGFSTSTIAHRPLISLRNEPHGGAGRTHRVQVTGIDQNTSPWATWVAAGTASLCLRAIEQHLPLPRPLSTLSDHALAEVARTTARNGTDAIVAFDSGYSIPALDIQRLLLEMALDTECTPEEERVLCDWEYVLENLATNSGDLLDNIGWVHRRKRLETYASSHRLTLESPDLLTYDETLDEIGIRSVAATMRETVWASSMPPEATICHRRDNPCPTTRAALRVREAIAHKHQLGDVDWGLLRLETTHTDDRWATRYICLDDPYATELTDSDNLVAK